MRSRLEAGAGFGIEKSGRGSRAPNQIQKFIFPPELSPNIWLPVQHFIYLGEPSKAVEVGLLAFGSGDCEGELEVVVAVMCEDGGVDFEEVRV